MKTLAVVIGFVLVAPLHASDADPLRIVVMDPLAQPLSCTCVDGYGQRRYDKLAAFLQSTLGRKVELLFDESLQLARPRLTGPPDMIIGKESVVQFDAQATQTPVRKLASLTNHKGDTELCGLLVVRDDGPLLLPDQLFDGRVMLGPVEDAEANAAARRLLALREMDCDIVECATIDAAVLAVADGEADAAFISDFMPPLLYGCGKLEPNSLRVLAQTEPVPFVGVYASEHLAADDEALVITALKAVAEHPDLLAALESTQGFVFPSRSWPDWRGPHRDGLSPDVPTSLPTTPRVIWSAPLTGPALAGIAATDRYVVVPDKDGDLTTDVMRCFDAASGKELWQLAYPAPERLDYTNAPRATPVIHDGLVYLQGALGDLHCVELATGRIVWKSQLLVDFNAEPLIWGSSSPPLVVDDMVIVNPGAAEASVVALDAKSGEVAWQSPGHAAAYSAFVLGTFQGVRQIIGYDSAGLGGWDPKTGERLWELIPPDRSDFNVGTPLLLDDGVLVATENNGARRYKFEDGRPIEEPIAGNYDLSPDTCSPVILDGKVFGTAYGEMACLDLEDGLRTVWLEQNDMFYDHTNLIAGNGNILLWSTSADLLLIRADADQLSIAAHVRPFGEKAESMSHPALVGNRLYVRSDSRLLCLDLHDEAAAPTANAAD